MLHFPFINSADSSLGRMDYASLPQHVLMEIISGGREEPKYASGWEGVEIDSETQDVIRMKWNAWNLQDSIDVQWISATVSKGFPICNNFSGTVDFTRFSAGMMSISRCHNCQSQRSFGWNRSDVP
ncbi:hypothetical protein XU18_1838 [Perkinsela sp. CCAP 1560/4]|nr:hypothetical protein XU18_1838 [Perkinsela sp. CCAP 1560/4]|eukprot:KNH07306.1 hypothetical protein XU18_1838 [Perkinsela sp. CCAP 1560/4]